MKSFSLRWKISLWVLVAVSLVALPASAVTYLKADAEEGGDGTSWATAYRNVEEAVSAAAAADNVIYAAGGLYPVTNTMAVTDGFEIYGGFPGLSMEETPDDRDVERHQTVLTGDLEQNDYWVNVEPVFGAYNLKHTYLNDKHVFVDGVLQMPPPYQGDYDSYYAYPVGGCCQQAFKVGEEAGATIDGLWFSGFVKEASIEILQSMKRTTVHGCRFIGNYPSWGQVYDRSGKALISSCQFRFSWTTSRGAGVCGIGATKIVDCLFEGHSRGNPLTGGVIYFLNADMSVVERCVFTRCQGASLTTTWAEGSYGGPGTILAVEQGKNAPRCTTLVSDCIVSNSFTASPYQVGLPLISMLGGTIRHCTFLDNRYEVKPHAGRAYTLFGNAAEEDYQQTYEGCTFRGNVIAAPSVSATEGEYGLGILGTASGAGKLSVVNCTFDSNSAEYVETPGVTAVPSRALVSSATIPTSVSELGVANCTFFGAGDGSVYDIVQFGTCQNKPLHIVNSLFQADGLEVAAPFHAVKPELLKAYDCSVRNAFSAVHGFDVSGLRGDPVPFAREDEISPEHVPVLSPAAETPGLRVSSDVVRNGSITNFVTDFSFRPDGMDWLPLLPVLGGEAPSDPLPITDANGHTRPFGAYTRGAVQTLAPPAEEGVSLTLRREPLLGGTLSDPATQATTAGGAIRPVTAIPAEGSSFAGWFDTEGTLYSAANPLEIPSLSNDLVLVARFGAPEVEVTFDLGEAGTFVENGLSSITLRAAVGASFPAAPPYEVKENWLILGWGDLPPFVPAEGGLFPVKAITKDLRIIHVVPAGEVPAGSDRSGDSWANATDDLTDAYANAGLWRGEVWMKEGVYFIGAPLEALPRVAIRGGFAGTERSATEADPVAHPTILTGDRNGDDFWRPDGVAPAEADRVAIWEGTRFNEPNPDDRDDFWDLNGNASDNTDQFLRDNISEPATEVVLDGVTITCFGSTAIEIINPGTDLTMRRCRYLANAAKCVSYYSSPRGKAAFVCTDALFTAEDCEFIGNHRAFESFVKDYGNRSVLKRCSFRKNHSQEKYSCLHIGNRGIACEDSVFEKNVSYTDSIGGNPVFYFQMPHEGDAAFTNCVFRENRGTRNAYALFYIARGHYFFDRCQIVRNEILGATKSYHHAGVFLSADYGYVVASGSYFADNRLEVLSSQEKYRYGSVGICMIRPMTFFNCTIVDNVASNATENTEPVGTFSFDATVSLVNSLVDGNRFHGKYAEFVMRPRTDAPVFGLINTIVRNQSEGYVPFDVQGPRPFNLANCAVSGIDVTTVDASDDGCLYDVSSDPGPISFTKTGPDGLLARGITASSPYARAGRPVQVTARGDVFYYDDVARPYKPWRNCANRKHFETTVPGLPEGAPLPPDAFGAPRVEGRIAYGPLNVAPGGTMLFLR